MTCGRARLALIALAAATASVPVLAQRSPVVVEARRAGVVGERFDGYLGFVSAVPARVRSQVDAVNIRRRALYVGLASRRGVSTQEVGITAGCQTLASVAVGEAYMLGDGVWRRRSAGQAAPVPDYCA